MWAVMQVLNVYFIAWASSQCDNSWDRQEFCSRRQNSYELGPRIQGLVMVSLLVWLQNMAYTAVVLGASTWRHAGVAAAVRFRFSQSVCCAVWRASQ